MKTTAAAATSFSAKTAGSASHSSNNNNNNKSNKNINALSSPSGSNLTSSSSANQRQRGNGRVGSAKYYDIASTILGGSGDLETVFLNAAKNGNLNKLEQMLSQTGHAALDIDCKDKRTGNTALMWAAKRGHSKVVELLLHHSADPTLCNYEAQTALELSFSPLKTVLLDWVDNDMPLTCLLLLQAAWQGNLAVVRKILTTKGARDINCQNSEGLTPLMLVSRDVQLFERLAAQLNRHYNPVEVARELIKAGADIHATDNDGRSSLHYVSQSRAGVADKLVGTLITGGMDPELRDKRLFAPIHLASQVGNTNNVVALVDGGSEVNIQGFAGLTPLHITAYNDHQKTTVTLLNNGADVCATDDRGLTPFDLAKTRKMKITLKEAWTDATKDVQEAGQSTVPQHVGKRSCDSKSKADGSGTVKKKTSGMKKKPEVIFDGLITNEVKETTMQNTSPLSTVERCKQTEKKILEDLEILKAAHPVLQRENSRILGTVRNKILPQIAPSTSPQNSCHNLHDSNDQIVLLAGDEIRRSWEENRQLLVSRGRSVSDIRLGMGRHSRLASLSSYDGDVLILDESKESDSARASPVVFHNNRHKSAKHHRSGSDPISTSMADIAASCENFLPNARAKRNSKQVPTASNASFAIPPASTFVTQKDLLEEDERKFLQHEDKFIQAMAPPLELLRCRSLLKEDFILEESRPSEIQSGSDPASSTSSLSSSSPRDSSNCAHFSPLRSHRPNLSFTALSEHKEVTLNDKHSEAEISQDVKPLIREPQRRIRHNSENSSSTESFNIPRTDSSSIFHSGKGLVKSQSLRRDSNVLNSVLTDSKIIKSHSLECLSPRPTDELTKSNQNFSKDDRLNKKSCSSSEDMNTSAQKKFIVTTEAGYDINNRKQGNENVVDAQRDKKTITTSDRANKKSQAAPFSGKARMIGSNKLDKWDSMNSLSDVKYGDKREKHTDQQDYVFIPVKSSNEPSRSASNQNTSQNTKEINQVTKSCTEAIQVKQSQQNKIDERRPKTSSHQNNATTDKIVSVRNVNVKSKNIQEATKSATNEIKSKEKPNQMAGSSMSSSRAEAFKKSKSSVNKTISKASGDQTKSLTPQTSQTQSSSVSQTVRMETSPSSNESKVASQFGTSKKEKKEHSEGVFTVTEESVRLGSASKIRMQEKLSAVKQKQSALMEKENTKVKKVEAVTPTTSKTRSVNKAAQIENSLRKIQTQNPTVRKSIGSSQNLVKSEGSTTKERLSSSSETAINGITRTFSTSNALKSSKEPSSVSSPKCTLKDPNSVEPTHEDASKTKNDFSAESVLSNQRNSGKTVFSVVKNNSKVESTSKSTGTKNGSVKQSVSLPKDKETAKTLDPNIILTPRSTEPLVKIKFESSSTSQTATATSASQRSSSTVISTPLIVNPYEGFSEKHNPSSEYTTTDAIVKLKKPQKSSSSSNKKKSSVLNKRPTSGSSRKASSASKKRATKSKDSKDETQNEGRVRSGKKRSNQNKRKPETGVTGTEMTADAAKADVALISGIGWQLSTSCVDSSDVKVAKTVNFKISPSGQAVISSMDIDEDNNYEENVDDEDNNNDDWDDTSELQLLPQIDDEDIDLCSTRQRSGMVPDMSALEVFKEKITLNSPRFQEMKRRQESQINFDLPVVTNDGFPPMNLDITQRTAEVISHQNVNNKDYGNTILKMSHDHLIQRDVLMDKLTPIPEASFVSKTINAISQFDKSLQGDKLSELLDDSSLLSTKLHNSKKIADSQSNSANSYTNANLEKKQLKHKNTKNYEYTSSGKAIQRTQSMKGARKSDDRPRERKFSETKSFENNNDEEENIDEAIEEILSSTLSSNASTLKGINQQSFNSYVTATHSLTEGDKSLLLKLKSSNNDSPFYAKPPVVAIARSIDSPLPSSLHDIPDITIPSQMLSPQNKDENDSCVITSTGNSDYANKMYKAQLAPNADLTISNEKGKKASKSGPTFQENQGKSSLSSRSSFNHNGTPRCNTPLRRASSMREARSKAKNLLDNNSSHNKLEITEEEAKQLARVMSSLRHMELHTGTHLNSSDISRDGFGGSAKLTSKKSNFSSTSNSHYASLAVRPSSTGGSAKVKGRFHEVKDAGAMPASSSNTKGIQIPGPQQEAAFKEQMKADQGNSSQLEDSALIIVSRPTSASSSVADAAEIENFYIDLTARRGSLASSECTVDSIKSEGDTIQWKKGNILGRGAFGTVWCGLTNEGELIAVKQIELTTMDQSKAQREYEKIQEEVELLKTLEHINIVGYLGTSLEDNIVSIFMQFIPGGSLASILARFGALDESVFRRYTKQILEGVNYLHENDVIHRDLKGANVMLMPTGVIKLIDFGCAKRLCINLNLSQTEILKSMKGTPFWMAPEVVNETGHGKKSDIWSIGCTVFEMATRKPPWADMNPMAAIFAIGSADRPVPDLPNKFTSEAINFVSQCLTRDQERRPSAFDLLNHPFIGRKNGRKVSKTNNDNSSDC